jgi:prepilin-type N-terminal cleavage/methylation domain-containing protein
MLGRGCSLDRGDTLIEVLFAISIFSLVAVSGLSIMNQGTSTSQRALEITLVRNEIDAQVETLRFLNASYIAAYQHGIVDYSSNSPAYQWQLIKGLASTNSASEFGSVLICPESSSDLRADSFVVNTKNATITNLTDSNFGVAKPFSQVSYGVDGQVAKSEGLWVEAISPSLGNNSNQANAGYIDFHIRACWDGPGQSIPVTIGTIVRLYEPRG